MDTLVFLSSFPLTGALLAWYLALRNQHKGNTEKARSYQWAAFYMAVIWAILLQNILLHLAYK